MKKLLLLSSFFSAFFANSQTINVYSYGFDAAFATDWTLTNQSSPAGTSVWTKANYTTPLTNAIFGSGNTTTVPVGHAGGNNSFALVNFNSTTGAGIISNWLITPVVNVKDGDIVSFYTRKGTDGTQDYPDRLEFRYSTAATTVVPSGGSSGVGSFTNVGVTVNPALTTGFVYPKVWTKYQFTIAGVGTTAVPVKFAFRYYVTDGGPSGNNSDLIGIDTFSVDRPTLSVSEAQAKAVSVSLYPNPTDDFLSFKTDQKILKAEVFDTAGKSLKINLKDNKLDVRKLPSGQYLLMLETEEGKTTHKFIKK